MSVISRADSEPHTGVEVSPQSPKRYAFILLTTISIAFLAASSAPTPLYSIFQTEMRLTSLTITMVFAAYAIALLVALLVFGSLSDHVGRAPVIRGALVLQILAMVGFLFASDATALILARALQGAATGIATAALGAALVDVAARRAPLVNSVTPILGMAFGALGAAIVATVVPQPSATVFVILLVIFVVLLVASMFLGSTNTTRPGVVASLRISVKVPATARRAFLVAAPVLVAVWAIGGFMLSLGPNLARAMTGSESPMVGGLFVFALTAAGALAVLGFGRANARSAFAAGAGALFVGVGVILLGILVDAPVLLFIGATVAGIGFGAGFQGAMRTVLPLAEVHERAALFAAIYVVSYASMSIPAVAAGILSSNFGISASAYTVGGLVMLLAGISLVGILRKREVSL